VSLVTPELLERLRAFGAAGVQHARGRTLFDHARETALIVEAWEQPEAVCRAALFHSIYGTDAFERPTVPLGERERVRAAIGEEAERLAFLFCLLARDDLRRELERAGPGAPLSVRRRDGNGSESLSPSETFALVVLHMANLLEQATASDGGLGPCLAALGRMASHLDPAAGRQPPLLERLRGPGESALPARFARFVAAYADPASARGTTYYPGLADLPWHDPGRFPIVAALEAAYGEIAAELEDELERLHPAWQRESEPLAREGEWDVIMLYERGRKQVENCARFPATAALVERFATVKTESGLVYFSRLRAGAHVKPHRGPTNLRVRCHLPLVVPIGDCAIRVGDRTRNWTPGRCLTFEDFFEHEAWNRTRAERVVLIVDLWHPDLSSREIELIAGLQDRLRRQERNLEHYWDNNERARRESGASGEYVRA
jgi:hypothetical protein